MSRGCIEQATDLGTADQVIGQPAIVRDKPGNGFGVGVGLWADPPLGWVRLEVGFSDRGDAAVTLTTGARFQGLMQSTIPDDKS